VEVKPQPKPETQKTKADSSVKELPPIEDERFVKACEAI